MTIVGLPACRRHRRPECTGSLGDPRLVGPWEKTDACGRHRQAMLHPRRLLFLPRSGIARDRLGGADGRGSAVHAIRPVPSALVGNRGVRRWPGGNRPVLRTGPRRHDACRAPAALAWIAVHGYGAILDGKRLRCLSSDHCPRHREHGAQRWIIAGAVLVLPLRPRVSAGIDSRPRAGGRDGSCNASSGQCLPSSKAQRLRQRVHLIEGIRGGAFRGSSREAAVCHRYRRDPSLGHHAVPHVAAVIGYRCFSTAWTIYYRR